MISLIFTLLFMVLLNFNFLLNQLFYFLIFLFLLLNFNYFDLNYYNYLLGVDFLRFMLILLTFWIIGLILIARQKINFLNINKNMFIFFILILLGSLLITFYSLNLFIFYLFFEISLIPTLILIIGWGYQPERIQAGIYLLFYTLFASLPILLGIFYLYNKLYRLEFYFLNLFNIDRFYLYISFNLVFLVKFPIYLFHLWLPKAHVEAPIRGSIILAGVILKLGGYGIIRLISLFEFINDFNFYFIMVRLLGGCVISLICLCQSDIKSLIAYSSVSHISIVIGGILSLNYWGFIGALIIIIAHGLCSSGIFCLANINYERVNSRSLFLNKGIINLIPRISLFWFLLRSSNMAAPPSFNLLGEIILINSLVSWNLYLMLIVGFISFIGAGYCLYLFSYSQHGKFYSGVYRFSMGYIREYLLLILHWLPLNILLLKRDLFIFN